jgi:hypothetical protein
MASKIHERKNFQCLDHKEMINVLGDGYINYPDLIFTHYLQVLKYDTACAVINMYNCYVSI